MLTDMTLTISGILTFTNDEKRVIEVHYDRKAGVYTPASIPGIEDDDYWNNIVGEVVMMAFTGEHIYDTSVPATITIDPAETLVVSGGILHLYGMLTEDDNTKMPVDVTLDLTEGSVTTHILGSGWSELLSDTDSDLYNQVWTLFGQLVETV